MSKRPLNMECPWCLTKSSRLHYDVRAHHIGENTEGSKGGQIIWYNCPECGEIIVYFHKDNSQVSTFGLKPEPGRETGIIYQIPKDVVLVFPKTREMPDTESIPDDYKSDYIEAYNVLDISPKASAALSRRCLQRLLRERAEVTPGILVDEINQVLDKLPPGLRENVDVIRHFGNFAAHANKNLQTGEIIDVEPSEAEWTLEILKSLLEYFVIKPAEYSGKRDRLNSKLKDAGKPAMK